MAPMGAAGPEHSGERGRRREMARAMRSRRPAHTKNTPTPRTLETTRWDGEDRMGAWLDRLYWIASKLFGVALLYMALMTLPALYLIDAIWNRGRVVSMVWP